LSIKLVTAGSDRRRRDLMSVEHSGESSAWPYRTLLLCGHFGPATPASRRLNRDSLLAVAVVGVAVGVAILLEGRSPLSRWVFAGGVVTWALWTLLAYRRYFAELDELSLRIQHEAIAFAFAATLLLGTIAAAATVVVEVTFHPLWLLVAEPLRGLGLVVAARRYR
jgi:hypothetical protein